MSDSVPAADLGEVLQLLAMSNRKLRASRADLYGQPLPTDEVVGVVLIDDNERRSGPDGFPTKTKAWLRHRGEVIVITCPTPPVEPIMALAMVLRDGFNVGLILTPAERVRAWVEALDGLNVRVVGFDDAAGRRTLH